MDRFISIDECIEYHIKRYFLDLDGEDASGLYDMVLQQVEEPLLRHVMDVCERNQTRAAKALGLNRNTLRKKLSQYRLLNDAE